MSTGAIGEYFIISELMRQDFIVLISSDPTQKDWDMAILKQDRKSIVKLQVKTLSWPANNTKAVLTGNFSGDFDFLIIVILGYPEETEYLTYIVPHTMIVDAGSAMGGLPKTSDDPIRYKNTTIPFSTFKKIETKRIFDNKYRDSDWHILKQEIDSLST